MSTELLEQLPAFIRGHQLAIIPATASGKDDTYDGSHVRTEDIADAHIILSFDKETGEHRPVLDIDFELHTVPSSTPGHFHLYLDKPMSWAKYEALIGALAEAGVIEKGYASVSALREYTSVRLPWVKKAEAE